MFIKISLQYLKCHKCVKIKSSTDAEVIVHCAINYATIIISSSGAPVTKKFRSCGCESFEIENF